MRRTTALATIMVSLVVFMGCSSTERLGMVETDDGQIHLTTLGPSATLASEPFEPAPYRLAAGDALGAAIFADFIAHLRAVMAEQRQATPPTMIEATALAGVVDDQES